MRKGRAEIIIIGRYYGGGYSTDFSDANVVLSPDGISPRIRRHRSSGNPPIVIVKDGKQSEDTDDS